MKKEAALALSSIIVLAMFITFLQIDPAFAVKPPPIFTEDELKFMRNIKDDYAWGVIKHLVDAGRVVEGTQKAYETAQWIRNEMIDIGLKPENVFLEEFPVISYTLQEEFADPNVGNTSVQIRVGENWISVPAAQQDKCNGTGPDGVTAEIVDVGDGKLEDFERLGEDAVRGKIVLFTRTVSLFYGNPVLAMAAERGALGAITHWPVALDYALKIDVSGSWLPLVFITNNDAAWIRMLLSQGSVLAKLVVDNNIDGVPKSIGHNVVGIIPGSEYPDQYVYLGAHLDHWFGGAADNNAGIGSLLGIAKAIVDSGITPKRTLVFIVFDAEETGGWADSWYDWCIGSFSHIVRRMNGEPSLNPDRPGKIVAMFNMDALRIHSGSIVYIETSPDILTFIRKVTKDSGLSTVIPTYVFWPPSSYDDWAFYMAGIPATSISWSGPEYAKIYHTSANTIDLIDPTYLHVNIVYNGLAMIRMAQAYVLPYNLGENAEAVEEGINLLYAWDPDATRMVDTSVLEGGLNAYKAQVARLGMLVSQKRIKPKLANLINQKMMQSALVLNPKMFDWDNIYPIPGWIAVIVFDNPARDLYHMKTAVDALHLGDGQTAMKMLTEVATMEWGQDLDSEARQTILNYMYYIEPAHRLWEEGFLPPLSDVYPEFQSIAAKLAQGNHDFTAEIDSLQVKILELYKQTEIISNELGQALLNAANILAEVH